ncbi:similar to Saccharomyces cerevisiae YER076C Putative protein of unknown function [Maudiozyma saulgeensis]|uniref:Uncharacterized protein n=1 Tax=Maudiozyma saulgeensis TaxID=1789683 RepID=A0A1X7R6Y5_9SACH|nr:similar to Saccharomyces cerevisiae YER076C Putative protein of unknown function [Kazachstania saulgeensis]
MRIFGVQLVTYMLFFFTAFEFVSGESNPGHNVTLFVNKFADRGPGSSYSAIGPGGITITSRYVEAIQYWKSLIIKSAGHSTLIDACHGSVCQKVTVKEMDGGFTNLEIRTKIFSGNVTGYTFSQLVNHTLLSPKYRPTSLMTRFKFKIQKWALHLWESFLSSRNQLRIDNILLGQYPGWTTFVTRRERHNRSRDVLPMQEISCITRSAIESHRYQSMCGICVHIVNIQGLTLDIRLFKDDTANFADPWGLPCSEVDNPSEYELECLS